MGSDEGLRVSLPARAQPPSFMPAASHACLGQVYRSVGLSAFRWPGNTSITLYCFRQFRVPVSGLLSARSPKRRLKTCRASRSGQR